MPMMAVLERFTLAVLDWTLDTTECVVLGEVVVALACATVFVGAAPWPVAVKGRKVTGTCEI
jgi:hypothetical protein